MNAKRKILFIALVKFKKILRVLTFLILTMKKSFFFQKILCSIMKWIQYDFCSII